MTEKGETYEAQLTIATQAQLAIARASEDDLWNALDRLDREGGVSDAWVDAKLTSTLWYIYDNAETRSWVKMAKLAWRLWQEVEGQVLVGGNLVTRQGVRRWQTWETQVVKDTGRLPAYNWAEFCETRLGKRRGSVDPLKRAWEVFAVIIGWPEEWLARAGKSRLSHAAPMVEAQFQEGTIDDDLLTLLVGAPHECLSCGEETAYDWNPLTYRQGMPEACPNCGKEYQETRPGTMAQVRDYRDRWKRRRSASRERAQLLDEKGNPIPIFSFQPDLSENSRTPITAWRKEPGQERAAPYQIGEIVWFKAGQKVKAQGVAGADLLDGSEFDAAKDAILDAIKGA